mgnify:CR=1 FL=1
MHKDIIGGVSPLKKVVKAKRSGHRGASKPGDRNYGREATSTEKRRGGFSKVTGSTNRGGYNVRTRFKVDPWVKPASGGDRTPTKPYSYDADGNMQVDPSLSGKEYRTIPGKEANISGGTYDEVWDANKDNFQDKWKDKGGKEAWIKQAEKEKKEGYYVGEGTDPRDQYRTWKQKNKDSEKTFSEWQDLVKNK